ncbi:MAG: hypothetical protein ABIL58_23320 [Pseudomonadota bacterium]
MITVLVINPTSSKIDLIVKGRTFTIPAHRFEGNSVRLTVREDCADALIRSIQKRPALRAFIAEDVPLEAAVPPVEPPMEPTQPVPPVEPPGEVTLDGQTEKDSARSEFLGKCKATKVSDGVWKVTAPDGHEFTIEADHHKHAKDMAFDLLFGAGGSDAAADKESDK